ncbi:hypothetical protein OsJ_36353 [Oryza sativa Japonica Group]|uniref:Uncharacterized protein n=1 Tax=Oryza sativa subsp. japonica TaxID=39947 RepID=A3CI17_ORYSJ|nr:hypothetical protein OsJ_36353 [Oryza sativa Japonica Group]
MTMHQQNMNLHEQSNAKKTRTGTKKPKKRMDPTMKSIYKDLQQTMDADTGSHLGDGNDSTPQEP